MIWGWTRWESTTKEPTPPKTPHLDSLAKEGVLFRNAYTTPVCSSTRAAIQTGRYGFRTGIGYLVFNGYALPLSEVTIPEMLDMGTTNYSHAAIGKWHMGNQTVGGLLAPNQAGYSHYSGVLTNISAPATYFSYSKVVNGVQGTKTGYLTTDEINDAIAWINGQEGPWFVYLALHAPHNPFHNPPAALHSVDLTSPTETKQYRAMVEAMDTEVGRLVSTLKRTGKLENTTIIFLGDNGTPDVGSAAPFTATHAKGTMYEGGINVPLIIRSPLVARKGTESAAFVSGVDIFATVAEIAGVNLSQAMPGIKLDSVSMVPYLQKPSLPTIRTVAYSEVFLPVGTDMGDIYIPYSTNPTQLSKKSARNETYKFIWDLKTGGEELYNLNTDPFETQNLLASGPPSSGSVEETHYNTLKQEIITLNAS